MRTCITCTETKPESGFHPNPTSKAGWYPECRVCRNIRQREYKLIKQYGITRAQRDQMYIDQQGCCAGCNRVTPEWGYWGMHVDHCHTTGRVRGLLCKACNQTAGLFEDDPDRLRNLAMYLDRTL